MKNIILLLTLLLSTHLASANGQCVQPTAGTAIYFGNGINTSKNSATASLQNLRKELGTNHNGDELVYALAYNQTDGMALDLLQAAEQQAVQINSRLMLWLNGTGLLPDWFSSWYQHYLSRITVVVAEEVANHANYYLNEIPDGRKVVVVSHSQGNFYVNEARDLLARQLGIDKMASFDIFGVAVPSDNIGGSKSPYLTNHRDFIQFVPRSLPNNWKLHRGDRTDAEDIGVVKAHLFNATYISDDFDIKPALIAGIKTQIESAVRPAHHCQTYNSLVSSLVTGRYIVSCGVKPNLYSRQFFISPTEMALPDGRVVNTLSPDTFLDVSTNRNSLGFHTEFGAFGGMEGIAVASGWDINRVLRRFNSQAPCFVDEATPPTSIGEPFKISSSTMSGVPKIYRLLPKGACQLSIDTYSDKPIEFTVSGTQITLGDRRWNIASDSEAVSTFNYAFKAEFVAPYTDPGFLLSAEDRGASLSVMFTRNKDITRFSAADGNGSLVVCSFDQRGLSI
jgi:hypothetical protein